MLAALPQPLEVQEVGGDSLLEGLAGPALIAVAAIIAAFVAAWVARRNHEEQLGHDRGLRDLDHARQSINSAVETVAEAVNACSGLAVAAWAASEARERAEEAQSETDALDHFYRDDDGELVETRDEAEVEATMPALLREENDVIEAETAAIKAETEAVKNAGEARAPASSLLTQLLADTLRLRITIGTNSEVVRRHVDVAEAFKEWVDSTNPDADGYYRLGGNPDEEVAEIVGEPIEAFVNACQVWSADHSQTAAATVDTR
jgi:hypothetical protein